MTKPKKNITVTGTIQELFSSLTETENPDSEAHLNSKDHQLLVSLFKALFDKDQKDKEHQQESAIKEAVKSAVAEAIKPLELQIKTLIGQNEKLTKENKALLTEVEDLESYNRKENLLIHGIPYSPNEDTTNLVVQSVKENLGLNILSTDISVSHRLGRRNDRQRPPPIIARFVRRRVRDDIMHNRAKLKGKGLVITDHLSPRKAALLAKTAPLVREGRIKQSWSYDGQIWIKLLNEQKIRISTEEDLTAAL